MKWLLGFALFFAALILLGYWARASWRRGVRRQLLDALREQHPEITVLKETEPGLELRFPDGTPGTLNLYNLYTGLAAGPRDPGVQREAIAAFVHGALSAIREASQPLTLAQHGARLMPRLADAGFGSAAAASGKPLIQRPTGIPGLVIVYVLDSEQSVMFLGEDRRAELGIDAPALHERAMENLRRKPVAEMIRGVIERREVAMVKLGDSYDATRLLLVPEVLADGEELVAVIPDRETLGLFPVPTPEAWPMVRKLAGMPASPYRLIDRPLRVTRAGFVLA